MKKVKSMFEKHDLFKIVLLAILVTIVLTWIIPSGFFTGGQYSSNGLVRQGIVDIMLSGVYSAQFFIQQLVFIFCVGIFYGIVSKISGYKAMVHKIAEKFKGKEKIFVFVSSLVVTLLATFLTQTYVILLFIPFIINIARVLKLDKITTFLSTFGSLLVGILGATFGYDGFVYFVSYLGYYTNVEITEDIGIRFGILALTFIVYHFFTVRHLNKVLNAKNSEEVVTDLFEVEEGKDKQVKIWPMATFFVVIFLFALLGYINWNANFNLTIFDEFHTWLTGLKIGDYTVLSYIIGSNAVAFGSWDLYIITIILAIVLLLAAIIYRVQLDELLDHAMEGIQKIIKPVLITLFVYIVFIFVYWSPFTVTITNWFVGLTDKFNPFITAISACITSLFHIDFGFTGYALGDVIVNSFGTSFNVGMLIYVVIHGLVQFVAPTSAILLLGLTYLDIPYKKWIKYIWKFALIMLALLLIIFALLAYL